MSAVTSVPDAELPRPDAAACDTAMLDALLAQSSVASAFIDTEFTLRRVSRSLADMIGAAASEQVGHSPAEVWPPALAARAEAAVRKGLADRMPVSDGLPLGIARRWGSENGDASHIALSWYPARGPGETMAGVTMIASDPGGEGAPAEAVRRTRERYRSLVQAGNQVV